MTSATLRALPRHARSAALSDLGLRYVLTGVCAASAGVHAGIIPEHLVEAGPRLGAVFAAAAALLLTASVVASRPRNDGWAPAGAAVLLVGTAASYLLSRTAGLPGLISDPEPVDAIGLVTSIAELVGAGAGIVLYLHHHRREPA